MTAVVHRVASASVEVEGRTISSSSAFTSPIPAPMLSTLSQFTLYGILKGNKPDFHVAMAPDKAKPFYAFLVESFRKSYKPDAIKDGVFGAMMKVLEVMEIVRIS
ncbi:uncharacterized protein LOC126784267 [Argentina anserina]|uniref:uncharacterized protein LOC126784267 n=1 Tax=Argentina anserina TaxID=57926 RepID=UPI00217652F4|nr:uncharacterized protein LOC126784267 [Potentilla anserina]